LIGSIYLNEIKLKKHSHVSAMATHRLERWFGWKLEHSFEASSKPHLLSSVQKQGKLNNNKIDH